jgi:hypothetical protein
MGGTRHFHSLIRKARYLPVLASRLPPMALSIRPQTSSSLSALLPTTNNEARLTKTSEELSDRLRPLADFWGLKDSKIISDSNNCPSFLDQERLTSNLSLPLPGEAGWGETCDILCGLYTAANVICTQYHQDKVHYRGLLEFSNICSSDCFYCGIRKSFHLKNRYALDEETIMDVAQ